MTRLRNRLFDCHLPDLEKRLRELAPFFRNAEDGTQLNWQVALTDDLID